jgi:hypothetical protein
MATPDPIRGGRVHIWVAAVITAAWAVSFVVDIVNPMYDPPPTVGSLMLIVAGAIFGSDVVKQVRGGGRNE